MSIKEIEDMLARPDLDAHHKRILSDVLLEMRIMNVSDSSMVDKQVLVAAIQKERID